MDNQQSTSGFPPHLQNQLDDATRQLAHSQSDRGRGRGGRRRNYPSHHHPSPTYPHQIGPHQTAPPSLDSFPPLGARPVINPGAAPTTAPPPQQSSGYQPPQSQRYHHNVAPREFFDRTRGNQSFHRPHGQRGGYAPRAYQPQSFEDFRRPLAPHGTLYQHNSQSGADAWPSSSNTQQSFRHQVMAQVDFLNQVQQDARNKYQLKQDEQIAKETFRKRLEILFQETLSKQYPELNSSSVRLKCYGSLNNGFGLAGCDMDLLLALPEDFETSSSATLPTSEIKPSVISDSRSLVSGVEDASASEDVATPASKENFKVGWLLEGALLDEALGARLLTKTRVPILKVCETPDAELLKNLRQYRDDQIKVATPSNTISVGEPLLPPFLDMDTLNTALSKLEDQVSAAEVPIPDTQPRKPKQPGAAVEFGDVCGIKCDVNFANSLALHNTRLLREYCLLDPRVAHLGVFVKSWAKTRDINTPYYGTLSSYGFVLMVLHFLMNVVQPPVIPNLQHLAKDDDAWDNRTSVDLFEGKYDIRFLTDHAKIAQYRNGMSPNRDSTGNLIRGFFWYYSNRDGFNWKNDIVSIRTRGGILKKFAKGWTEAKWSEQSEKKNVRLRYLMAIEDPFETEHNVARVVGHHGIVAIRDEFRRAWSIITSIGIEGAVTEDLMKPLEGRGDLLRKDQDHHREKMKQNLGSQERAPHKAADTENSQVQENGQSQTNGTWSESDSASAPLRRPSGNPPSPKPKLTDWVPTYRDKPRQYGNRVRRARVEEDRDSGDADTESGGVGEKDGNSKSDDATSGEVTVKAKSIDDESNNDEIVDVKSVDDKTKHNKSHTVEDSNTTPVCSQEEINLAKGFDVWGKPIAWDVSQQDGRWLQWRDYKIRAGTWTGVRHPDRAVLDQECPFDARRPITNGRFYRPSTRPPTSMGQHVNSTHNERTPPRFKSDMIQDKTGQYPKSYLAISTSVTGSTVSVVSSSPPTTLVEDAMPTTAPVGSPHSPENENITLPIEWAPRTTGGAWLRKRDGMILAGTFDPNDHGGWYQQLHNEFPYNPDMKISELQELNEKLEQDWSVRPFNWRRYNKPKHLQQRHQTATQSTKEVLSQTAAAQDAPSQPSTEPQDAPGEGRQDLHSLQQVIPSEMMGRLNPAISTTEPPPTDQVEVEADNRNETMPNSAFIRSRRLAFFAQQHQSDVASKDPAEKERSATVATLMQEAGIDINRPNLTKRDSAVGIWAESDTEAKNEKTSITAGPSLQSPITVPMEADPMVKSSHNSVDSIHSTEVGNEPDEPVPSTLYPEMSADERPPAENPNIMPIPRTYGFKFDVRQLRDLTVIQEGGNGCARDGQEFEIEQDYEWGGGGEMGHKSTSGFRESSGELEQEVYEYGRGDEEGLLNELPGLGD